MPTKRTSMGPDAHKGHPYIWGNRPSATPLRLAEGPRDL